MNDYTVSCNKIVINWFVVELCSLENDPSIVLEMEFERLSSTNISMRFGVTKLAIQGLVASRIIQTLNFITSNLHFYL